MQNGYYASLRRRAVCFGGLVTRSGAVIAGALALSLAGSGAWAQGSAAALDDAALINLPSDHVSIATEIRGPASTGRGTARAGGSANVDLISPPSDEVVPLMPKTTTPAAKSSGPKAESGTPDTDMASLPLQSTPNLQGSAGAAARSARAMAGAKPAAANASGVPMAEDYDGPAK